MGFSRGGRRRSEKENVVFEILVIQMMKENDLSRKAKIIHINYNNDPEMAYVFDSQND